METNTNNMNKYPGVPLFVMFPLESVKLQGSESGMWALSVSLLALKNAGVEGVMMDIWWGDVEKIFPGVYDWSAYDELICLVQSHGLKMQAVMSTHQCGETSAMTLTWVLAEAEKNPDIFFSDKAGWRDPEYISLGCDLEKVLPGKDGDLRSPVEAYADFYEAFKDHFGHLFGEVIIEIQVGMGPCGELRYPGYPAENGWVFPGIGEFQCYDKYLTASLQKRAESVGNSSWGKAPDDAGAYNQSPEETGFFKDLGTWSSPYGQFFLKWYSDELIKHGDRILKQAHNIFQNTPVRLSAKVSGVHWQYRTASHAAEQTVGYNNITEDPGHDAYLALAKLFAQYDTVFNFTCMEIKDAEQSEEAKSSPESLIKQVAAATLKAGVRLSGENALSCFDLDSYAQIVHQSTLKFDTGNPSTKPLLAFTYLRLRRDLFESDNWSAFVTFVKSLASGIPPVDPK